MVLWLAASAASTQPQPLTQPLTQPLAEITISAQDATAAAPTEPKWTGAVGAGIALTTGNSETRQANVAADAELKREKDRITLGFLWVYADNKNNAAKTWTLTDRKTFGRAKYDYFFTEKTYAYGLVTAEGDLLQDIALRWTAGAGVGHQYLDNETWKFGVEAGVTVIDTDYRTASTTDTQDTSARIATNTSYKLNESWSFAHTLEAYPSIEDTQDFYGRSDFRVNASLTESMVAGFQWVVDYDNTPAAGRERVDNRYLLSLGWKF